MMIIITCIIMFLAAFMGLLARTCYSYTDFLGFPFFYLPLQVLAHPLPSNSMGPSTTAPPPPAQSKFRNKERIQVYRDYYHCYYYYYYYY